MQFVYIDLNKAVPQSFSHVPRCLLKDRPTMPQPLVQIHVSCMKPRLINTKPTELSGRRIMQAYAQFKGANIAIVSFKEVWLRSPLCLPEGSNPLSTCIKLTSL